MMSTNLAERNRTIIDLTMAECKSRPLMELSGYGETRSD